MRDSLQFSQLAILGYRTGVLEGTCVASGKTKIDPELESSVYDSKYEGGDAAR